jgi:predicted enzyme related to lactoylglutathione lyase
MVGLAAWALLVGCTARATYQLPPITVAPTPVTEPGRFVWFELVTDDVEAATSFYGGLFGWELVEDTEAGIEYWVITHRGLPIGGVAQVPKREEDEDEEGEKPPPAAAAWLATMAVPDLEAELGPLASRGGLLHLGPLQVEGRGRMAVASDPGGAMIVLLQPRDGAPPESDHEPGRWIWVELWAEKPAQSIAFYGPWVGYRAVEVKRPQEPSYHVLARGMTPRAGLAAIPIHAVKPNWLPYVQVADLDATITRAQQLGGRLFARDDDAAVLIDPAGAAIGVQEWHGEVAG